MKNSEKYGPQYFMPPAVTYDWVKKDHITAPPTWCSVDLRDGNQALIEPMSLEEKLEFFKLLVDIGFKEIEVGFPAASETEYTFMRRLIDDGLIPDDVTVQVLTQARDHIIRKTFEAVKGAPHAVIHLYNSTSVAQREQVFKKSKEQVKQIAVDGAKLLLDIANETEGNFSFQYSPESFPGTEVDYALDVCNAVLDVWKPTKDNKAIINLPTTVENSMPHVFASQVEYMHKNLKYRDAVTLCVHPHNDRGCGVCDAEFAVLAGADRIEGTLFGNGERTGNVDIITLAMNMFSHGVDPKLDFSNMPEIVKKYEQFTNMHVYERSPYAGELVFSAFSGSHQDAIAKGIKYREDNKLQKWNVPYLPIDPMDVGRTYDSDVIRINSQSGKGGVAYILNRSFGLQIPEKMREELGYTVKSVSDHQHKELTPDLVYNVFSEKYITNTPIFTSPKHSFRREDNIKAEIVIELSSGSVFNVKAEGNGRLDAVSKAFQKYFDVDFDIDIYEEHALTTGSTSKAVSYVRIKAGDGYHWGVGIDEDIIRSSIVALVVAVNQIKQVQEFQVNVDPRIIEMIDYIRDNYQTVTLDELASKFYLSKQYISKYIKEKSGMTFCDNVKKVRMKKAEELLATTSLTVEKVAESAGYPSVEHFNRRFKKMHGLTPVQYRNKHKDNK